MNLKSTLIVCAIFFLVINLTFARARVYDFVVAQDGSGNFKTVQEAINAVPDFRKTPTRI